MCCVAETFPTPVLLLKLKRILARQHAVRDGQAAPNAWIVRVNIGNFCSRRLSSVAQTV